MTRPYEASARVFCQALKELAANPEALDNLESYLSYHFPNWLSTYASTPAGIAEELQQFASIEF